MLFVRPHFNQIHWHIGPLSMSPLLTNCCISKDTHSLWRLTDYLVVSIVYKALLAVSASRVDNVAIYSSGFWGCMIIIINIPSIDSGVIKNQYPKGDVQAVEYYRLLLDAFCSLFTSTSLHPSPSPSMCVLLFTFCLSFAVRPLLLIWFIYI